MRIVRAEHLGMCFGVRDAIALALEHGEGGPLTILGDLVHNPTVLAELRARGIAVARELQHVATPLVMVTAHGTSERTLAQARARSLQIVDATCPLVRTAHRALAALVRDGYHPIIIGRPDHVEVRGLTGDLHDFDVIQNEQDVLALRARARMGIAAQTTQPYDRVERLVRLIRNRFPRSEVRFLDTVCRPTKERQKAAADLARRCDVVIVIGGADSNNTRELVNTCREHCSRVHHVRTASDLGSHWFRDADVVGITAGTSTPDHVTDDVERRIREFADSADERVPYAAQTW